MWSFLVRPRTTRFPRQLPQHRLLSLFAFSGLAYFRFWDSVAWTACLRQKVIPGQPTPLLDNDIAIVIKQRQERGRTLLELIDSSNHFSLCKSAVQTRLVLWWCGFELLVFDVNLVCLLHFGSVVSRSEIMVLLKPQTQPKLLITERLRKLHRRNLAVWNYFRLHACICARGCHLAHKEFLLCDFCHAREHLILMISQNAKE